MSEQVPGTAEPGQKCREREKVEGRNLTWMCRVRGAVADSSGGMCSSSRNWAVAADYRPMGNVSGTNVAKTVWQMRDVQMPAQSSREKRQQTESESHDETDQIKICPGHCVRLPSPAARPA